MLTHTNCDRTKMFASLFKGYEGPSFCIRLWDGWLWTCPESGESRCTLVFNSPSALATLILRPSERTLGDAFLVGDINLEGDLFSVFAVTEHVFRCPRGRRKETVELFSRIVSGVAEWWTKGTSHTVERDRRAISYHYDQPAAFYRPWLGESLVYSCAYFESSSDDLTAAQTNKLELICRKLRLRPDDRFLDIGCGWGSLILHAASRHNVYAQGITVSQEQAAVAAARIEAEKLTQTCRIDLLDYREGPTCFSPFDKIASVGMFEHVGIQNMSRYFQIVYEMLKPGGVFLNHGIARASSSQKTGKTLFHRSIEDFLGRIPQLRRAFRSSFIDRYVFPDGELATISETLRFAESAGFEVRDVDNLREHYELTLRAWIEALRKNAYQILKLVPEITYRTWILYMAGSAAAFRRGDIVVYQTLLSRPDHGQCSLPLSRRDWYVPQVSPNSVYKGFQRSC